MALFKRFLCWNKWYFASHWLTIFKSYILYLFLIAKKSHTLLAYGLRPMFIKNQIFLFFLQTFCLDYSLICTLLSLFPICFQLLPIPLFCFFLIFGAASCNYKRTLPICWSLCLYISLSSMSLDPWFYLQISFFIYK